MKISHGMTWGLNEINKINVSGYNGSSAIVCYNDTIHEVSLPA